MVIQKKVTMVYQPSTQVLVRSRYSSHDHDKVFFNSILLEGLFVLLLFHVANIFFPPEVVQLKTTISCSYVGEQKNN